MLKKLIIITAVIFITAVYFYLAIQHSLLVNTRFTSDDGSDPGDQRVQIKIIKRMHEENFSYLGDRVRTPLYSALQAVFYQNKISDDQLFNQGKLINIILSLFLIFVIYFATSKYLTQFSNIVFILITGLALFLPKAAYLQPELLYYTLSFIAFIFFIKTIKNPGIRNALASGVFAAIAYLTKASMFLGFSIFVVYLSFLAIVYLFKFSTPKPKDSTKNGKVVNNYVCSFVITLLVFITVLSPYLIQNKKLYGKYFFNYVSEVYMWYDSFNEATKDTKTNNPDKIILLQAKDELPSLTKYLQGHDLNQIISRTIYGAGFDFFLLFSTYAALPSLIMLFYLIFMPYIFISSSSLNKKNLIKMLKENLSVVVFLFVYFSLNAMAIFFYEAIGGGPRFILSLYIPLIFVIFYIMDKLYLLESKNPTSKINFTLLSLLHMLTLVILLVGLKISIIPVIYGAWAGF
ncbi:hypothetical protein A2955_00075 [Candidatus Woesebacteria bacterium RIFCSPLOWO2_01_FULL_37_19]|uniref:Glycosyltransferase RgtA/B/C/D-like domain-containing protein n=2 Tax=Candidatus Woeseibacteriota TaxID=1752722 RepID=A0A1F8B1N9_9BACT|nr:MAG: hypothetical protein A2771_02835 [Candidatus Woesebacteria bacterium RIFCSPHIGHO2_01_FULL_38_26b]OGM57916.1 MAG: hypothetical protein A2955_00075 [Candidatus Woesebacteria bacterium RIFCSPLOWO2_01_FULL_37_19]